MYVERLLALFLIFSIALLPGRTVKLGSLLLITEPGVELIRRTDTVKIQLIMDYIIEWRVW